MKEVALNPKYHPIFEDDSRYFVVTGGRGSGKSFGVNTFLVIVNALDIPISSIFSKNSGIIDIDAEVIVYRVNRIR